MRINGYMGQILFVNLSDKTTETVPLVENLYREYIGGYGLGVRILYEKLKPHTDPHGSDNILGFLPGSFTGTKYHGAGRFNVVGKSPLTNGWADSSCGGNFGPKLRATGYDGIFILGQADKPVYLYITDEKIEFRDAAYLWGKDSKETEELIKAELGRSVRVACIGQAGEKLSRISGIIHDHGRAAARCGLGGVMGSKKLKALAVDGMQKVKVADLDKYEAVLREMRDGIKVKTRLANNISTNGTNGIYLKNITIQDAPIQNWKGLSTEVYPLDKGVNLSSDAFNKYVKKKYACAQCAIVCGAILEAEDKQGNIYETHRPEYETVASFGSLCLIDDTKAVMEASELCNRYGFDTISAGATIAFAMECFEKGLITLQDTGGLSLEWGNSDAMLQLLKLMAKREGIGAVLADGVKVAAEKIGNGAEAFAMHVGGQEVAMHDPRCWPGFGYGYAFDPAPGRHTTGGVGFIEHGWHENDLADFGIDDLGSRKYDYNNKGKPLAVLNNWFQFFNATGMCVFNKFGYENYPLLAAVRALTGWDDLDLEEALKTGERINTLRHCFNLREGLDPKSFALPKRIQGEPPLPGGPTGGVTLDMEKVRKSYYEENGWDQDTGKPSDKKLKWLNLDSLVNDLP